MFAVYFGKIEQMDSSLIIIRGTGINSKISEFISKLSLFYEQGKVEKILQKLQNYLIRRCAEFLMESRDSCRLAGCCQ